MNQKGRWGEGKGDRERGGEDGGVKEIFGVWRGALRDSFRGSQAFMEAPPLQSVS